MIFPNRFIANFDDTVFEWLFHFLSISVLYFEKIATLHREFDNVESNGNVCWNYVMFNDWRLFNR